MAIGEIDPTQQDVASVIGAVEFRKWDGRSTEEGTPAWTATLSDETGEAELVVWDEEDIPQMYDASGLFEPDGLHVKGAQTGEYEGALQLVVGDATTIESAQLGAGRTTGETPEENQGQLQESSQQTAEADGGKVGEVGEEDVEDDQATDDDPVPDDAEGRLADARALLDVLKSEGKPLERGTLLAKADLPPDRAKAALAYAVEEKGLIMESGDGFEPV